MLAARSSEHQVWEKFVQRVEDAVTALNGLVGVLVNEEVSAGDIGSDLPELLTRLKQVEAAIYELETLFWKWSDNPQEESNASRMDTP